MATSRSINSWKLLKELIDYAQKLYLVDAFFWLFILGLPIVPGLIIREFFNTLTAQSQLGFSPEFWICLFLATGLGRVIFIFIGRVTKTQHRFTISALVRRNLFESVLNRPGAMPMRVKDQGNHSVSVGEAISYFRDDTDLIEDNVVGTSEVFNSGIFAFVALAILLTINAKMTLLVFLPLVGIIIAIGQAKNRIKLYRQASREATEQVTGLIGEIFHSVQAIKVAGAEKAVLSHFHQLNFQRRQTVLKDQLFTAILQSIFHNLVSLGTGGILLLAATFMHDGGTLTVGDFALFIYYLSFITEFVTFLGQFLTSTKQTEVSFERMEALVSNQSSSNAVSALVARNPLYLQDIWGRKPQLPLVQRPNFAERDCLHKLTVSNLTYLYPNTDRGITDVNFTLLRGSLTVITGRIGTGKTTLLRALLGLLPQQTGEIYWNDHLITDPANFFTPPRSAYTPQVPQLFGYSLRENILLGLQKSEEDMIKAMETAVFDQEVATMHEGLETLVGVKGVRLSGGQLQRAAAARMLVRQPELLVFDDLSSALDVETEQKLWERLLTIRSTDIDWIPTCLVVSHRPYLLHRADQVIVLRNDQVQPQSC